MTQSFLDNYQIAQTLGKGTSAVVKKAKDIHSGKYVALKIYRASQYIPQEKLRVAYMMELSALNLAQGPNIVSVISSNENGLYIKKTGETYRCMYFAINLGEFGSMFMVLKNKGKMPERIGRFFFVQLIKGLVSLHSLGIVHRDLKADNLLVDHEFNLKICDFGLSYIPNSRSSPTSLRSIVGTESYMAPEIFSGQPYNGFCCDIFAAGVVLFMMITRQLPFRGKCIACCLYNALLIGHPNYWKVIESQDGSTYSPEFKSLITQMLAADPTVRLTLSEIQAHPWFNAESAKEEEVAQYLYKEFNSVSLLSQDKDQRIEFGQIHVQIK